MTIIKFIRILIKHWKVLAIIPMVIALTIFIFTANRPDQYYSNTVIYTGFTTGFNITSGDKMDASFFRVNTLFYNILNLIKTRAISEEVAMRLLATHISNNLTQTNTISSESEMYLNELIPKSVIRNIESPSIETTYQNIRKLYLVNDSNLFCSILNNKYEYTYSIAAIEAIMVQRLEGSDIIKLEYFHHDASTCKTTLEIITEVFLKKYSDIKRGETINVVRYFEEVTQNAYEKLNESEEKLKWFRSDNGIINYDEQSKFISVKRESITDEVNGEKMKAASAEAAISSIESQMGKNGAILIQSEAILNKRNELSDITAELALSETWLDEDYDLQKITKLKTEAAELKLELENDVNKLYDYSHTKEGIPVKDLLSLWLENAIAVDESAARLTIYMDRKEEVENIYDFFAPLGSNLSKMEREIAVREKEYLSLLESLNSSQMSQKNLEVSSLLKVIDPPYYPYTPQPTGRSFLIIMGAIVGLLVVLGSLIATELIDTSIGTPERAAQQIGLTVCGGLPILDDSKSNTIPNTILKRLYGQIIARIDVMAKQSNAQAPFVVAISSTRQSEGKTLIGKELTKILSTQGKRVLHLMPLLESDSIHDNTNPNEYYYPVGYNYTAIRNIRAFMPSEANSENYDILLLELPALLNTAAPIGLDSIVNIALLVTRSNRLWNDADQRVLDSYKEKLPVAPFIILNGVDWYELENFIGELPKQRSEFRKTMKKFLAFNFSKNINFKKL